MKQIQKFLFVALLLCLHAQLMAQYITLKGKQFYDQSGQPFYPVVCNYIVELAYDPTSSTSSTSVDYYVLQPYISYGLENHGYNDISGVSVAQFASGCYFVKVSATEKTEIFKLIINKY